MKSKGSVTKGFYKPTKMTKEELEYHYDVVKRSAHVHKDKSKFDKKRARQQKRNWDID